MLPQLAGPELSFSCMLGHNDSFTQEVELNQSFMQFVENYQKAYNGQTTESGMYIYVDWLVTWPVNLGGTKLDQIRTVGGLVHV